MPDADIDPAAVNVTPELLHQLRWLRFSLIPPQRPEGVADRLTRALSMAPAACVLGVRQPAGRLRRD